MQTLLVEDKIMKKDILVFIIVMAICSLSAEIVGKIRFILGEVHYKDSQNLSYKIAALNTQVNSQGYIKTGPGATAEIQWTNGSVYIVEANKQESISKLLAEANSNTNWNNKLWDKVNNLKQQNKQGARSVAGIRREEAEVKKESQLFWYMEEPPNIDSAVELYEKREFAKAIPIFEKVINYGPLKREAEMSHAYLILIYGEMKDKTKQKKHVDLLKADFPDSSMLNSLPPEM